MAGDWMKIDLELPDKPEIHSIAGIINKEPEFVVGALIKIWAWFDKHTEDGNAYGVTYSLPDRITGVTGFGEAMMLVGWLEQNDKTLTMPKFDRHTSASAKKRALTNKRVEKTRNANVTLEALPREEKRRDNIKVISFPIPEWLDKSLWEDFRSMRNKIKKPMTERAEKLIINLLDKFRQSGLDYKQALENSIRNSWQDVYEPKFEPSKSKSGLVL